MSYNIIQHTRHNSSSQFHVEKYLHQETASERGYLPLNREAINWEITGLESTGMPCFVSMPEHIHSPLLFLYLTDRDSTTKIGSRQFIHTLKKECLARAQIYTCQCTWNYHTWLEILTAVWNSSQSTISIFQYLQYGGKQTDFREEFGNNCNSW